MPRFLLVLTLITSNVLVRGSTTPLFKGQKEVHGLAAAEGLGNIGCTFSKEVCDPNLEFCFNDNAFGRCLPLYGSADGGSLYRYSMSKSDFHLLEKEMERLFAQGYRWGHAYTQCVLQSYLDAIRNGWKEEKVGSDCVEDQDQDLKGALKAFSENIDPWDLAFIKFAPSSVLEPDLALKNSQDDSHRHQAPPDFANEVYVPAALEEMLESPDTAKQHYPAVIDPALGEKYVEDLLEDYIEEDPAWSSAKKSSSLQNPHLPEVADYELMGWNEYPLGLGGRVNENIIQPKIFTPAYNTPDSFRHGLETKDELEFLVEDPNFPKSANPGAWQENELDLRDIPIEINEERKREYLDLDENDVNQLLAAQELIEKELREEQAAEEVEEALRNHDRNRNRPTLIIENEEGDDDLELDNVIVPIPPRASPLFTEGGVVFLNNNPKRFIFSDNEDPAEVEAELESALNGEGSVDSRSSGFERRERLDVKKPGPWYRTVNNFAFDYDEKKAKQEENALKHKLNQKFSSNGLAGQNLETPNQENSEQAELAIPSFSNSGANSGEKALGESPKEKQKEDIGELMKLIKRVGSSAAVGKFVDGIPAFGQLDIIDTSYVNVHVADKIGVWNGARELVNLLADFLDLKHNSFREVRLTEKVITFKVEPNDRGLNASEVAKRIETLIPDVQRESGIRIEKAEVDLRTNTNSPEFHPLVAEEGIRNKNIYIATFAACGIVAAAIVAAFFIFLIRKSTVSRDKFARLAQDDPAMEACKDYQDLCRARMASKNNEKPEPIRAVQRVQTNVSKDSDGGGTSSSRSSTSSWTEEPVLTNMDISTGHMVLSYMEDHLKKKDRLDQEWAALCTYEADPGCTSIAEKAENAKKNRYSNSLPYDHSRVILNDLANVGGTDYINASTITDHDPRNPAYIATQGPLSITAADFWQMVWEQGSVVIVTLTKLSENGTALCHRYWPEEGSELHHIYEVHLVSEHIWCDEYLVRSFYLKNLKTGETRTVTQFHFLAWPENGIPNSTKAILEFRRKVNKSYRGRSCPIIIHCSDGCGRAGTYCLIDLVLNRMAKGAKEIDIAASLEHIRDQRPGMVRTKQQFEFVLMAVAEEVHAILKAMPQ